MRFCVIFFVAGLCAGCAQQPKTIWLRTDGQRVRENPILLQEAELAKTMCLGERQKAALSGVTISRGGLAGAIAEVERGSAADQVGVGCMAGKGYILVPEDQAETKNAELQAIAELKKKQETPAQVAAKKMR